MSFLTEVSNEFVLEKQLRSGRVVADRRKCTINTGKAKDSVYFVTMYS